MLQPSDSFGHIEGVPVGKKFGNRMELKRAGLHKWIQAGISNTKHDGATCIVINGEYPDEDNGYELVYIGSGGNKEDQQWDSGYNSSLVKNFRNKRPVRVVRGSKGNRKWSPYHGFSYDGLYQVVDAKIVLAKDSDGDKYKQCQFWLKRLPDQQALTEYTGRNMFENSQPRRHRGRANATSQKRRES